MNANADIKTDAASEDYLWDRRYENEGLIWGDDESPTCRELSESLKPNSNVFEVGFGYGRDLTSLASQGHSVTGIERSMVAFNMAANAIDEANLEKDTHLIKGHFEKASLPEEKFDALLSHRVLHLLGNGQVKGFVNQASYILKPGGLLVASSRDMRDFNPDKMQWREDGQAEYTSPERKGHIIDFWNEDKFRQVFEKKFDIEGFIESDEIESLGTDDRSKFTIMIARKKQPVQPANDTGNSAPPAPGGN